VKTILTVVVGTFLLLTVAGSAITVDTVPVGDPGNTADTTGHGAVPYSYNIGTYEVTAGQYCEFLNAVAKTDTHALYNANMWSSTYGCKIERTGSPDDYRYSVASDYANRPVNYVSFWDACRFTNWLHNGGLVGSDTETGAYTMTADGIANNTVARNAHWRWAVTSEDEWYKAAYYKTGSTDAGYFQYPTASDNPPSNDLTDPDPGNNATYAIWTGSQYDYTINTPYWRTQVGAHQNSASPCGAFDQGGNVYEWHEAIIVNQDGSYRGIRGGSFCHTGIELRASSRGYGLPTYDSLDFGFRVVQLPEPAALTLLALGTVPLLKRKHP